MSEDRSQHQECCREFELNKRQLDLDKRELQLQKQEIELSIQQRELECAQREGTLHIKALADALETKERDLEKFILQTSRIRRNGGSTLHVKFCLYD